MLIARKVPHGIVIEINNMPISALRFVSPIHNAMLNMNL
jgi:hypothetical protein